MERRLDDMSRRIDRLSKVVEQWTEAPGQQSPAKKRSRKVFLIDRGFLDTIIARYADMPGCESDEGQAGGADAWPRWQSERLASCAARM